MALIDDDDFVRALPQEMRRQALELRRVLYARNAAARFALDYEDRGWLRVAGNKRLEDELENEFNNLFDFGGDDW